MKIVKCQGVQFVAEGDPIKDAANLLEELADKRCGSMWEHMHHQMHDAPRLRAMAVSLRKVAAIESA